MIQIKDAKRSLVIPKWLSLSKINFIKENEYPREKPFLINKITLENLNKDFIEFKNNPQITLATDLFSSAYVINDEKITFEIASYLENNSDLHPATINLLNKVLKKGKNKSFMDNDDNLSISKVRNFLKLYPRNALLWIELGRLYTIKGLNDKALKAIIIALELAPSERFIVRAGFRFFIHIDEFERAFYYAKKAVSNSSDPWLKAIEINGAILNNFNLNKIKKLNHKLIPNNKIFQYSELIESIGMIELNFGNDNKAKKNFKLAWSDPSQNVISHGEWILRNRFPSLVPSASLDFSKSNEALTWRNFFDLRLDDAIVSTREWILEEPYSSHPFMVGSGILCLANKPNEAVKIAQEGLIANPRDQMLKNNLAYAYLKSNNISKAEDILNSSSTNLEDYDKLFYLATKGLLEFKKGNIEIGRNHYYESFDLAQKKNEPILGTKAFLNLAIAEIEANTTIAEEIAKKALTYSEDYNYPDFLIFRKQIKESLNKRFIFNKLNNV